MFDAGRDHPAAWSEHFQPRPNRDAGPMLDSARGHRGGPKATRLGHYHPSWAAVQQSPALAHAGYCETIGHDLLAGQMRARDGPTAEFRPLKFRPEFRPSEPVARRVAN